MNLKQQKGIAHVLGDNVPHDGAVMSFDIVLSRVTDPQQLIPHLFAELDPGLRERIKPGDIIVAGKNFLSGKAHNAGLIAMKALGLAIICESMSVRAFQGVVALAIPVLIKCEGITQYVQSGDEIAVDFLTGEIVNLTRSETRKFPPMDPAIRKLVEGDGMRGTLVEHLANHPELGTVKVPEFSNMLNGEGRK